MGAQISVGDSEELVIMSSSNIVNSSRLKNPARDVQSTTLCIRGAEECCKGKGSHVGETGGCRQQRECEFHMHWTNLCITLLFATLHFRSPLPLLSTGLHHRKCRRFVFRSLHANNSTVCFAVLVKLLLRP